MERPKLRPPGATACRFEAVLPGREGHDGFLAGRPGAWKQRPPASIHADLLPVPPQMQHGEHPSPLLPPPGSLKAPLQPILPPAAKSPRSRCCVVFAPLETELRALALKSKPQHQPIPPAAPRQLKSSRFGIMKAMLTDLLEALNGTSIPDLKVAIAEAEAAGAGGWQEVGLARGRLDALQKLQTQLEDIKDSSNIVALADSMQEARRLRVHQDVPLVKSPWPLCDAIEERLAALKAFKAELSEASQSSSIPQLASIVERAHEHRVMHWPEATAVGNRFECLQRLHVRLCDSLSAHALQASLAEASAFRVTEAAAEPLGPAVVLATRRLKALERAEKLRSLARTADVDAIREATVEIYLEALAATGEEEVGTRILTSTVLPELQEKLAILSGLEWQLRAATASDTSVAIKEVLADGKANQCDDWPDYVHASRRLVHLGEARGEVEGEGCLPNGDASGAEATGSEHAVLHVGLLVQTHRPLEDREALLRGLAKKMATSIRASRVEDAVKASAIRALRPSREDCVYVEVLLSGQPLQELQQAAADLQRHLVEAHTKPEICRSGPILQAVQQHQHIGFLFGQPHVGHAATLLLEESVATHTDDFDEDESTDAEDGAESSSDNSSVPMRTEAATMFRLLVGDAFADLSRSGSPSQMSLEQSQCTSSNGSPGLLNRHSFGSALVPGLAAVSETDDEEDRLAPVCRKLITALYHRASDSITPCASSPTSVQLTGSCRSASGMRWAPKEGGVSPSSASMADAAGSSEASTQHGSRAMVAALLAATEQALRHGDVPSPSAGSSNPSSGTRSRAAAGSPEVNIEVDWFSDTASPHIQMSYPANQAQGGWQLSGVEDGQREEDDWEEQFGGWRVLRPNSSQCEVMEGARATPCSAEVAEVLGNAEASCMSAATPSSTEVAMIIQAGRVGTLHSQGSGTSAQLAYNRGWSSSREESTATPSSTEVAAILLEGRKRDEARRRARTSPSLLQQSSLPAPGPYSHAGAAQAQPAAEARSTPFSLEVASITKGNGMQTLDGALPADGHRMESRATVYSGEGDEAVVAAAFIHSSVVAGFAGMTPDLTES